MKLHELKNLEKIIYRHLSGLEINSLLTNTGISEQEIVDLIHKYDTQTTREVVTYDWSFSGGSSDWSGGGNPHRLMEEQEARKVELVNSFVEYCEGRGCSPSYCEDAIRNKILK